MKKSRSKSKKPRYYLVLSDNLKINFGAFPDSNRGFDMAREWAKKMQEETGQTCKVKKM
jgi:hypothetical protein